MRQVIEYITVKSQEGYFGDFDEEINNLIKEGFQPFGSPYVTASSEGQKFQVFQAMVKYKED